MKSITLSSPVWHRKQLTLAALAVAGLSFSNFALAQLEEVIVTATRMGATDLQDTALAITAYTSEDLERMVATDVRDLQHLTPGLVITENTGMAQVYIRGMGTNNVFAGSDPSSTVHVDGIYIARPVAVFNNFLESRSCAGPREHCMDATQSAVPSISFPASLHWKRSNPNYK